MLTTLRRIKIRIGGLVKDIQSIRQAWRLCGHNFNLDFCVSGSAVKVGVFLVWAVLIFQPIIFLYPLLISTEMGKIHCPDHQAFVPLKLDVIWTHAYQFLEFSRILNFRRRSYNIALSFIVHHVTQRNAHSAKGVCALLLRCATKLSKTRRLIKTG